MSLRTGGMRRSYLFADGVDCGQGVTLRVERFCEIAVGADTTTSFMQVELLYDAVYFPR